MSLSAWNSSLLWAKCEEKFLKYLVFNFTGLAIHVQGKAMNTCPLAMYEKLECQQAVVIQFRIQLSPDCVVWSSIEHFSTGLTIWNCKKKWRVWNDETGVWEEDASLLPWTTEISFSALLFTNYSLHLRWPRRTLWNSSDAWVNVTSFKTFLKWANQSTSMLINPCKIATGSNL